MREVMRRTFDELWIIDLGGDNLGTRKTPNVFNIQTPVAIAIGLRGPKAHADKAAKAHYTRIDGDTRKDKLAQLDALTGFDEFDWRDCPDEWQKPFLPAGVGDFFDWPRLDDIFPWAHSGAQFKRSWPIGESRDVLIARINSLKKVEGVARKKLFKESRDRKITSLVKDNRSGHSLPSIYELKKDDNIESILPYSFRSFDRQYAVLDARLGDYLRPSILLTQSERQIFFTTLLTKPLAGGAATTVAAYIPDLHHFRGSFGGRDTFPMYRDAEATNANVTKGLLDLLSARYAGAVTPEDLAAYVYALLGGQSYTARFWNELETPGPRVPMTKDGPLFRSTAALGRRLIWLHTYGERLPPQDGADQIPPGTAKTITGVPSDTDHYPEEFRYDPIAREIHVGAGKFGPVPPEIWAFEVSGLKVVQSWLGYRMKKRSGKKSSPLDDIRPEHWAPRMSDEFLELLWVLEATLDMEPELAAALDAVVASPCFKTDELPQPSDEERKPPKPAGDAGDLLALMGVDDDDEGGEDED